MNISIPKWCLSKLSYQKDCPSWRWLHLLKRTDAWPHLQKSTGKPCGETVAACHRHLSTEFSKQSIKQPTRSKSHCYGFFANQFIHSTCYHLKNKSLHSILRLPALSQWTKLIDRGVNGHCWIFGSMQFHKWYRTFVLRGVLRQMTYIETPAGFFPKVPR